MERKRIGVFVCHCGLNIASSVDVNKVVEEIKTYPGVAHAEHLSLIHISEPTRPPVASRMPSSA